MAVDYLGRPKSEARQVATETPSPDESSAPETETPTPVETTPTPEETKTRKPKEKLITQGITVQVLNGTDDAEAGEAMAERLRELGYQVVAVESSSTGYKETTVFWSLPDTERAAKVLADRFDWAADEKPANLADTVSMHVVVGKDEI